MYANHDSNHWIMRGSNAAVVCLHFDEHEQYRIGSIVRRNFCPALPIDAEFQKVVAATLNQNFVPIVDGRGVLCGILTRKNMIEYLAENRK